MNRSDPQSQTREGRNENRRKQTHGRDTRDGLPGGMHAGAGAHLAGGIGGRPRRRLSTTLQATGKIDAATASEIESAIAGLPTAYRETATELSSTDNAAEKVAKITGYYASTIAALQVLPSDAQVYASAISASIQTFLSGLSQTQTTRPLAQGGNSGVASKRFDVKRLNRGSALARPCWRCVSVN